MLNLKLGESEHGRPATVFCDRYVKKCRKEGLDELLGYIVIVRNCCMDKQQAVLELERTKTTSLVGLSRSSIVVAFLAHSSALTTSTARRVPSPPRHS